MVKVVGMSNCLVTPYVRPIGTLAHVFIHMLLFFRFSAVFVVDNGKSCFVWVGSKASVDERRKGIQYAHVSRLVVYESVCI